MPIQTPLPAPFSGRPLQIPGKSASRSNVSISMNGFMNPGYFIAPTIVAEVQDGTRLVDEEPFGPILPILRFRAVEDAVRRANSSRYGLSGSVWTNDLTKGSEIAERLEAGTVWVNQHGALPDPRIPFGGAKESGIWPGILGAGPQELHGAASG